MIMKRFFNIAVILFLFGCSEERSRNDPKEPQQEATSRFKTLELTVGMNRAKVEDQIAVLLGKQKSYSPYGNNLKGGAVNYRDGDWVLEVIYKSGSPAPQILLPDGSAQDYPPIDETVLEYKIERISSQAAP
jgi:hypothetical protein